MDEGNHFWVGRFSLSNYLEGANFEVGTPFVFDLYGEDYHFIVDTKTVSKKANAEYDVVLECLSPAVQLIAPRAQLITKTWTETTTALAVVTEVLNGFPFDWQLIDWPLPGNLYAVADKAPLEIVKELVEAVGGLVESLPDGSLVARHAYPTSVPGFTLENAEQNITEAEDVFEVSEGFRPVKVYNRYRISNGAATNSPDRLEYESLTEVTGKIRAYPNPWRDTFTVQTTRLGVFIGAGVEELREETEVVEVVNGETSVRYPIAAVLATEFLDVDLGGVSFEPGSATIRTTSTVDLYSLLRITYRVRSIVYDVVGPANEQAQFLMVENDG